MSRKEKLEQSIAKEKGILSATKSDGWKNIEKYIRTKMAVASEAWHSMKIDDDTNEKIVRHLLSQRAVVKSYQDLLDFVYGGEAVIAQDEKEIAQIEQKEREEG